MSSTRQRGSAFKKLDTRQLEILTNFLQIARLLFPKNIRYSGEVSLVISVDIHRELT